MNKADIYDVTIVGGGPVGLFAAFYAGLRELKTKVIEALPELGGQLVTLYPEKMIYDVAGFPEIVARDLAERLWQQASRYQPTVITGSKVQTLEKKNEILILRTEDGEAHYTRTVIVTAGIGAFTPNTLNCPGVKEYEHRGVYYFARNFEEFRGKDILIVGGGDSAVDWALNLYPRAHSVTLIHRREGFRAHEKSVRELLASPVNVKLFWELKELRGDDSVKEAVIFDNRTHEEEKLPVHAVILALGFKANIGSIEEWGFELDGRYIKTNVRMETSIPGVFACGDIVSVEGLGNMKLLATGFAQAAIAVGGCKHFIDPRFQIFGGHSSTIVPQKNP